MVRSSTLTRLDLPSCAIADSGATSIAQCMASMGPHLNLRTLNLTNNRITSHGVLALARALSPTGPDSSGTWTRSVPLLTLGLSHNRVCLGGAAALCRALARGCSLVALELDNCCINASGCGLLLGEGLCTETDRSLTALSMRGNGVDGAAIAALAHSLSRNCSLTTVGIGEGVYASVGGLGNVLGDKDRSNTTEIVPPADAMQALAVALQCNATLTSLSMTLPPNYTANGANDVEDVEYDILETTDAMHALAFSLRTRNWTLTALDLGCGTSFQHGLMGHRSPTCSSRLTQLAERAVLPLLFVLLCGPSGSGDNAEPSDFDSPVPVAGSVGRCGILLHLRLPTLLANQLGVCTQARIASALAVNRLYWTSVERDNVPMPMPRSPYGLGEDSAACQPPCEPGDMQATAAMHIVSPLSVKMPRDQPQESYNVVASECVSKHKYCATTERGSMDCVPTVKSKRGIGEDAAFPAVAPPTALSAPAPVVPEQSVADTPSSQTVVGTAKAGAELERPAADDVSAMSLRELKVVLDEHGVDYSQCVEKREFRDLATQCLDRTLATASATYDTTGRESKRKQNASTSSDAKSQLVNWGKQRTRIKEPNEKNVDIPRKSSQRRQSWWKKAK